MNSLNLQVLEDEKYTRNVREINSHRQARKFAFITLFRRKVLGSVAERYI
jgi:hypothetical protein